MEQKIGGWPCTAALTAEGCVLAAGLLARLAGLWLRQQAVVVPVSPALLSALGSCLIAGLCSGPLRLGRFSWYAALTGCQPGSWPGAAAFGVGCRRVTAAIGWRWGLWWRRALLLAAAALPSLFLLEAGQRQIAANGAETVSFWLGGALLLALSAGGGALWWQCRYAAAPIFLLEGCTGGEALRRSARLMRGHQRAYLNFLGDQAAAMLPGLLILPLLWLIPRFRRAHTALLLRWRQESRVAGLAF